MEKTVNLSGVDLSNEDFNGVMEKIKKVLIGNF